MNRLFFRYLLLCFLGCLAFSVSAQDWVYFKQGGKSRVKLIEVTDTEITYKLWDQPEGPLFRVSTRTVSQLKRGEGPMEPLTTDGASLSRSQIEQGFRQAIMLDLMGPLLGYGALTHHYRLPQGLVLETIVGMIGLGQDYHRREDYYFLGNSQFFLDGQTVSIPVEVRNQFDPNQGFFLKFGPRLRFSPQPGLKGFYLKPEVMFSRLRVAGRQTYLEDNSTFTTQSTEYDYTYRQVNQDRGFLLNTGYFFQYYRLCLDVRLGLGYMFSRQEIDIDNLLDEPLFTDEQFLNFTRYDFRYSHIFADTNYRRSLALSLAITAGIAF